MSMGIILGSRPFTAPSVKTARLPQAIRLGATRIPNEYYPTPPEATRALLSVERFDGSIWESRPAAKARSHPCFRRWPSDAAGTH